MSHLTKEKVLELYNTFGELKILDDIIRHRAADNPPAPIFGYPKSEDDPHVYEKYTGQQIDKFVDGAVKYYLKSGLKTVRQSNTPKESEILADLRTEEYKRGCRYPKPI